MRCFVGRFTLRLDETAVFFGDWMTGACRRGINESFMPYVLRSIVFSSLRLVQKGHAIEDGSIL